jgi:hypothetical protein
MDHPLTTGTANKRDDVKRGERTKLEILLGIFIVLGILFLLVVLSAVASDDSGKTSEQLRRESQAYFRAASAIPGCGCSLPITLVIFFGLVFLLLK